MNKSYNSGKLLICLPEGCLELRMRINQSLDLVQGVDDEHIDQVLPSSVQPVVKGRSTLGKLKMKAVNSLENLLCLVHTVPTLLGECAQPVPLITDLLAPEHTRCD